MMKKNLIISGMLLVLSVFFTESLKAEVKLPAIFGDHMVLQQQSDAAIWGKADPGKSIKVQPSWDNRIYSTQADSEGNWKLEVKTPSAGGPYELMISDGQPVTLKDVLIGEVWVCSGQSNMAMKMKGLRNQPVLGSNKAIATSTDKSMRLFTVEKEKSMQEQDDFSGRWKGCDPGNVANFSAVAYFFGEMVRKTLDVPVGLICSSWGGTRIEPWISENGINKFDWVNLPEEKGQDEFSAQTPAVLFNAMIAPMAGLSMRGALWYQGESNRNEPVKYGKLLPGLIENWRDAWRIGDFPFYYVQIAPFDYGKWGLNSAYLREAQLKASTAVPNTGMISLMDVGEKDCIHPANKQVVGERLAYQALANAYGKEGIEYAGPVLKEMKVEGSLIRLSFDHAENGLTTFGEKLENFEVAGKNKRFYPAHAFITGKGVTVFSEKVQKPVAVRYAFSDFVVGNLFNTAGLPAPSFRTDDWKIK